MKSTRVRQLEDRIEDLININRLRYDAQRETALRLAIQHSDESRPADVLSRAAKFHAFLRGQ